MVSIMNIIESRVNSLMSQLGACIPAIGDTNMEIEEDQNEEMVIVDGNMDRDMTPLVIDLTGNASNVPDFTKNTIIYCRVSTVGQELQAQIHACRTYCDTNGYVITDIITEKGSAYSGRNQPELKKIITTKKNVNLLVYSIDRFSRNAQSSDNFIKQMEKNNINLKCVKENINLSTARGKHDFRNIVSLAQYESELIGERVKNNIRYKRQNNMHIGRAPYGYNVNRETGKLERNPIEQHVISFILGGLNKDQKVCILNDRLRKLLSNIDQLSEYVPIEITLEDDQFEYQKYSQFDTVRISRKMICEILTDYNIKPRGKKWTPANIKSIVSFEFKHNINSINRLTI